MNLETRRRCCLFLGSDDDDTSDKYKFLQRRLPQGGQGQ